MKKIVLATSLLGVLLAFIARNVIDLGICTSLNYDCRLLWDKVENISYFFIFILLFSLITYKMKPEAFRNWWKFARVAIPIILVISTVINLQLHHTSGGFFNMDNMFDLPALILMYSIFVMGSLIQIYRGYRGK